MKRISASLAAFVMLFSTMMPTVVNANTTQTTTAKLQATKTPIEQMMQNYGVSLDFIEGELNKGYFITEIQKALDKHKSTGVSYDTAIQSIHPSNENANAGQLPVIKIGPDHPRPSSADLTKMFGKGKFSSKYATTSVTVTPNTTTSSQTNWDQINLNQTWQQSPFAVPDASYSTLNGAVLGEYKDMSIAGKNGFGFTLTRGYDSSDGQLYDVNYSTLALSTKYDQTVSMLGLGWRWEIPSLEMTSTTSVKAIHMADGNVISTNGASPYTFSGYQWKDLSLKTDSTVVSGGFLLISTKDHIKFYFNNRGELVKMTDVYGNSVTFKYGTSFIDPVTYKTITSTSTTLKYPLSEIDTSTGNAMTINYCPSSTTVTAPCTSTDQQVVVKSGNRSIVYKDTQNLFSTGNNMLLLSSVTQAVDSSTSYQTQYSYWAYDSKSSTPTNYKSNPYALLSRITYPTGATANYLYSKDTLINYDSTTSHAMANENDVWELNETYKTLTNPGSVDPQQYNSTKYDRVTLNFNGYNMTSLAGDNTFAVKETRDVSSTQTGLTKTYTYLKSSYNKIPYYVASKITTDDGSVSSEIDNSYSQLKDDGTTTVTTYPYPNLVTTTMTSDTDSTKTLKYYSNTNYTDYGEIRNKAEASLSNPPKNTLSNTYDSTNRWLLTSVECVSSDCSDQKSTQFTRDTNTGAVLLQKVVDAYNPPPPPGGPTPQEVDTTLQQIKYTYAKDANSNITGNLIEQDVQDAAGNNLSATTYAYDANSFPTSATTTVKNNPSVTKSYTFDKLTGELSNSTDGNGNQTTYTYDDLARVTGVTYPDNTSVSLSYTANSTANTLVATYSSGTTTLKKIKVAYDALGEKTGDFISNGTNSSGDIWMQQDGYVYDINGRTTQTSDATGVVNAYTLDNHGRKTQITYNQNDTNPMTESYQYNDIQLTQTHTDRDNHTLQTTFDLFGHQTEVDQVVNGTVGQKLSSNTYDEAGNVLSATDSNNNTTNYTYDAGSQLKSVTTANSVQTNYTYDTRGLQLTSTNKSDNTTVQKVYDELGRLVKETDAAGKVDTYTYDSNGNMKTHTDNKGQVTTYTYDSRNRVTNKTVGSSSISYTYDALGRRATMTDGTGTTTYAYTFNDKIDHVLLPDGLTTSYQYDPTYTLKTGMTDPFGQTISYQNDTYGRVTQVTLNNSTTPTEVNYTYTGTNLNTMSEGNNVVLTYAYDLMNRLSSISEAGASNLSAYNYSYDKIGNITSKSDNSGSYSFTYDNMNRILQQTSGQNADTYGYDNEGNRKILTSSTPVLPTMNKYQYDGWNQLTQVTAPSGQTVTYRYTGDGLLYERTDSVGTTRYYYDDNQNVIAEATVVNGTPTLLARYIRGLNDRLVARQAADGSQAYYLSNGHGDVTELRDSNGQVLNTYYYDIWGNPTTSNETVENPFRYSGELYDSTSKLIYLKARWYDPSQGRFIGADSVQGDPHNPMTLNLYSYVQNNPLTNSDPSGHWCENDDLGTSHPGGCNGGDGNTNVEHDIGNSHWTPDSEHNNQYYYTNHVEVGYFQIKPKVHFIIVDGITDTNPSNIDPLGDQFAQNGDGDFETLCLYTGNVTDGVLQVGSEELGVDNTKSQAVADDIVAYNKAHPDTPIVVIGYSGGATLSKYALKDIEPSDYNVEKLITIGGAPTFELGEPDVPIYSISAWGDYVGGLNADNILTLYVADGDIAHTSYFTASNIDQTYETVFNALP